MSKKSSINESIFYALKNSETSKVPILLIGSAGTGKSTTVEMFAQLRGYELLLLRGSTASEQEIMGFMSVHQGEKDVVATNVLPTWYLKMMEYHREGKKTLLFLDEITAVNPYVQAALLHLIFERKVNEEKIPDDTLIVSAGNYSGNLTNEFELLSPVVNRFCVFNITPDENSLDEFLKVYDGASIGKSRNIMKEKADMLAMMDSQKINLSEEERSKVGYYFETAIRETTRSLMTSGQKPLSFSCTDTQSLYKSQDNDEPLHGFVSLRTLSYLTRITVAAYENFGVDGIKGSNYRRILDGLVGIALSRGNNGDVIQTKVAENYHNSVSQTLASISKIFNTKIKSYEEFFNKIIKKDSKTKIDQNEITIISDKIDEMIADPEIKNIAKPLEDEIVTKFGDLLTFNIKKTLSGFKINPSGDTKNLFTVENMTGAITQFNNIFSLFERINNIVVNPNNIYPKSIIDKISVQVYNEFTNIYMKISSYLKIVNRDSPEFKNLIPELKFNPKK